MVDRLNSKTNEAIESLCRKISVAHDLDAEIQEELRGHIEDKLLAYLDGEEPLSEEDAFILVREHFGNPAEVKVLLQDVHAYEAHVSLARRIAAVLIVSTGVSVATLYTISAIFYLFPVRTYHAYLASRIAAAALTVVLSWLILRHWQRRLEANKSPWFITWPPAHIVLFALSIVTILGRHSLVTADWPVDFLPTAWSPYVAKIIITGLFALPIFECMLWLWWCDRPPRSAKTVANVAGVWVIWTLLTSAISNVDNGIRTIYQGSVPPSQVALATGFTLLFLVVIALIACGIYKVAHYAAANHAIRSTARRA